MIPCSDYTPNQVRIENTSDVFPWVIPVPDRDEIQEIFQLSDQDRMQLMREAKGFQLGV
jgi:hypothetical protein